MSVERHERKECKFSVNKKPKAEILKVTLEGDSMFVGMCSPLYYVKNTKTEEVYIFDFDIRKFLEDFGIKVTFKETTENAFDRSHNSRFKMHLPKNIKETGWSIK